MHGGLGSDAADPPRVSVTWLPSEGDALTRTSDGCDGRAIPPGGSCTTEVPFAPKAASSADLPGSHTYNAGLGLRERELPGLEQDVSVLGAGIAAGRARVVAKPAVAGAPHDALEFPPEPVGGASRPLAVELVNVGDASALVDRVVVSGRDAASFVVTSDGCSGATIAPAAGPFAGYEDDCYVGVTERPRRGGRLTASLALEGDSTGGAPTIALSGLVPGRPQLEIAGSPVASQPLEYGRAGSYPSS